MNYWQTDLVRLRGIEPRDAKFFFRWNQDVEMGRNLDFLWPPVGEYQVEQWAEVQSRKRLEKDAFHWVIENLSSTPVGSISTHDCDAHNGTFSYGIGVVAEHRRRGYAVHAIRLVLRYYFEELRYQKVTIAVHEDNRGSIALHESLGFQREGTLRRMVYSQGRHWDVHWYGMTAEEWQDGAAGQAATRARSQHGIGVPRADAP